MKNIKEVSNCFHGGSDCAGGSDCGVASDDFDVSQWVFSELEYFQNL